MKCSKCFTEIDDEVIKDYESTLVKIIKCDETPVTTACYALNKHNPELMSRLIEESKNDSRARRDREESKVDDRDLLN